MTVFTKTAVDVFAPENSDGSTRSVENQDAQVWGTETERGLKDLSKEVDEAFARAAGVWVPFDSEAEMNANLNYPDRTEARVYVDNTIKVYKKNGASGTGNWAFVGEIDATSFDAEVSSTKRALAYQMLLVPPKIVIDGDSIFQENSQVYAPNKYIGSWSVGEFEAALALDRRLNFDTWFNVDRPLDFDGANAATSGDTTDNVLSGLSDVVLMGAAIYFLAVGINDVINTTNSEAYIKANYEAIISQVLAAGVRQVVVCTMRPIATSVKNPAVPADAARRAIRVSLNNWIRSTLSKMPNVVLCDLASGYEDTANPTKTSTVTITAATPGVVSWVAHGLPAGTGVKFSTTGALLTGLTAGATYYVVSPTTDAFSVAATVGGAAIATSGTQSGTHTASTCDYLPKAGSLRDGTHPTAWGAWTYGAPVIIGVLQRICPPFKASMPLDVDNLLVSAPFHGTSGIVGTRMTGTLPNNVRANLGSGSSTANCVLFDAPVDEYHPAGSKYFAFDITPAGTAAYEQIFIDQPSVIDVSAREGQWIRAWADVECSNWDAWGNISLLMNDQGGTLRFAANGLYAGPSVDKMPAGPFKVRLMTPPYLIPDDGSITSLGILLRATFFPMADADHGYLTVRDWWAGPVPDPRPVYNRAVT